MLVLMTYVCTYVCMCVCPQNIFCIVDYVELNYGTVCVALLPVICVGIFLYICIRLKSLFEEIRMKLQHNSKHQFESSLLH